jgi:iron complex outermembrane receptor protein
MHCKNTIKSKLIISILITFGISGLASAQIEEVVVTAQKRAESIQDIPFAITALSQDTLDRAGITSLEEFAYKVPGLAISGQNNARTQINIRGINSGEVRRDNTRASETVGIYFDEIPLSTALYNPDLEAFDLARVEVLRGPQGTLYGSGSLAGTIRLVSQAPIIDEFEGLIDAGFNSVKSGDMGYSVRGMVNIPMGDTAAARVAAYTTEHGGWTDNLSNGPGAGEDVNTNNKWGIRASLLWEPTANLSIRPTFIHQKTESDGTAEDQVEAVGVQRLIDIGTLTAADAFDPSQKYQQWKYLNQFHDDEVDIANLLINYDFENVQLTSSSSYTNRDVRVFANISENNLAGGFFIAPPPSTGGSINVLGIGLDDNKSIESFAQELRFTSTHDGDFQWIAGGYYSEIHVGYFQTLPVTDPRGITGVPTDPLVTALYSDFNSPPGILLTTEDSLETEQVAIFGEASYRFADRFNATVGLRYFDVEQVYFQRSQGRLNGNPPLLFSRTTKDDGINPKFLLSYEASDDMLLSIQAAKGFRLGGPQLFVPTVSTPGADCPSDLAALGVAFDPNGFDSEELWNYELAMKSTWADGAVQFNASAFFIDYENLQITTRLTCGFSFTDNAEGAESKGIEFELQAAASENVTVGFGGSYTDTELTADLSSGEATAGDELNYVPNLKLNAFLDYSRPVTDTMNGYLSLNVQHTGDVEQFWKNGTNLPVTRSRTADSYTTANLRIGVEQDQWEVAAYINNLWNEYGTTYIDSINPGGPAGWVTDTTIRPRVIGLNAKYRF